jgi:hypothetical protein
MRPGLDFPDASPKVEVDYLQLLGSLMYLGTATRPDISNSLRVLGMHNRDPRKCHWDALMQVLRYVHSTSNKVLHFAREDLQTAKLVTYVDASYATATRGRSVTGIVTMLGKTPIHWKSVVQKLVAKSSCEAELYALSHGTQDTDVIIQLLEDVNQTDLSVNQAVETAMQDSVNIDVDNLVNIQEPITVYCDNRATLLTAQKPPGSMRNMAHIRTKFFYFQQLVEEKRIILKKIEGKNNPADFFTKTLEGLLFHKFADQLLCN